MDQREYGEFDALQWENNYKSLKSELEKAFRQSHSADNLREAKNILIQVQGKFKEYRLKPSDREELYGWLQDEFRQVNERQANEKNKFEQQAWYNYTELKMKVEEAIFQASRQDDWREARPYLIEAQSAFKGLSLIREQREELYNKLQEAFNSINLRMEQDNLVFRQESIENYSALKPRIEAALLEVASGDDFMRLKDNLIQIQNEFKGLKLEKDKRELLYAQLQKAFDILNQRISEARDKTREIAGQNYEYFLNAVADIEKEASLTTVFKEIREKIRNLQSDLRDSILLREQKDLLYSRLQECFQNINRRQDQERAEFENEAVSNYKRLGKMVSDGLTQAQESSEFRETREFLKKIQGEFKGIRMAKEQREELYSRLQSAFTILRERTDNYFREKQKNWEIKMEFRLKDLSVNILELQMEITKEKERMEELENQLDILEQRPADSPAKLMVLAQLQSVRETIRRHEHEIEETQIEVESLQVRLKGDEPAV